MGSTTTNRHGVAAFDFATVFGCDQLVVGPTHARGGTLDLMTYVPDVVGGAVVASIGIVLVLVFAAFVLVLQPLTSQLCLVEIS